MNDNLDPQSKKSVEAWLANWVATELALDAKSLAPDKTFLSYGMNSVQAMMLVGDLEDSLSLRLSPTLVWDYPTIEKLAHYVVEKSSEPTGDAQANGVKKTPSLKRQEGAPALNRQNSEALLGRLHELSEAEMDSLLHDYLKDSH